MTDESNTEMLTKEKEDEILKELDRRCEELMHRAIYGPSQEDKKRYISEFLQKMKEDQLVYYYPLKKYFEIEEVGNLVV